MRVPATSPRSPLSPRSGRSPRSRRSGRSPRSGRSARSCGGRGAASEPLGGHCGCWTSLRAAGLPRSGCSPASRDGAGGRVPCRGRWPSGFSATRSVARACIRGAADGVRVRRGPDRDHPGRRGCGRPGAGSGSGCCLVRCLAGCDSGLCLRGSVDGDVRLRGLRRLWYQVWRWTCFAFRLAGPEFATAGSRPRSGGAAGSTCRSGSPAFWCRGRSAAQTKRDGRDFRGPGTWRLSRAGPGLAGISANPRPPESDCGPPKRSAAAKICVWPAAGIRMEPELPETGSLAARKSMARRE